MNLEACIATRGMHGNALLGHVVMQIMPDALAGSGRLAAVARDERPQRLPMRPSAYQHRGAYALSFRSPASDYPVPEFAEIDL